MCPCSIGKCPEEQHASTKQGMGKKLLWAGQAITEERLTSGMLCTAMASAMTAPKSVKAENAT